MINEIIELKVRTSGASDFKPVLKCYIPEISAEIPYTSGHRPAVIVCPGGGYEGRAFREDEPIALTFASKGFAAFVLEYSVAPARFPQALCEVCEAISVVKKNASEWGIDSKKIFICGFSAGGHLASSAVTMYGCKEVISNLGGKADEYRPTGGILCYPVISYNVPTHIGSFRALLGEKFSDGEMLNYLSTETHIDKNTPSCFIWATSDDSAVPVQNSLIFAQRLTEKGIKYELEIFHHGEHGLSLCSDFTDYNGGQTIPEYYRWIEHAITWIKMNF